jgi:hypothetical protein
MLPGGRPELVPIAQLIDGDRDLDVELRRAHQFPAQVERIPDKRIELAGHAFDSPPPELYCLAARKLAGLRYFVCGSVWLATPVWRGRLDLGRRYTQEGHTLLHLAVLEKWADAVHLIVAVGSSADEPYLDRAIAGGNTALHLAVHRRSPEIVAELLRAGASPFAANANRELPFDLAAAEPEIARLLREQMALAGPDLARRYLDGCAARKLSPERREEVALLRDALAQAADAGGRCAVRGCSARARLRRCHLCLREFCCFHLDRHDHDAGQYSARRLMEDWRPGI